MEKNGSTRREFLKRAGAVLGSGMTMDPTKIIMGVTAGAQNPALAALIQNYTLAYHKFYDLFDLSATSTPC